MRALITYILLLVPFVSAAQSTEQHSFSFEGYRMRIVAAASDDKGTLVFAGSISALEGEHIKKDALIDSLMEHSQLHDNYCIVLQTDRTMQIKHVTLFYGLHPSALVYDPAKNMFWLGGSRLTYDSERPEMSGKWQITLLRITTATQKMQHSVVETNFSCRLDALLLKDETLQVIAIQDSLEGRQREELPVVLTLSATSFHRQKYFPFLQTPDILGVVKATTPPANHIMLSAPSLTKESSYFGATAFPFGHVPTTGISVYQYKDQKLVQQSFMPDEHNLSLYYLTNCFVTKDANFVLAYIPYPGKKFYILAKVNAYMEVIWKQTVNDLQYPDFYNEVFELPDGKIVAAAVNKEEQWVYFIYSSSGALVQEINSGQPVTLRPAFGRVWKDNTFICIFSPPSGPGASVVQLVNVN